MILCFLFIFLFFSKTNPSFFTIKEGSTSHLGLLPSGKKRKPLLPVALNRFAIRLTDHQRSRQYFVRDGTAWSLPIINNRKTLSRIVTFICGYQHINVCLKIAVNLALPYLYYQSVLYIAVRNYSASY